MRLESGPAKKESIIQFLIFLALFAYGFYFFYDWKIGYPAKNKAHAIEALPAFLVESDLQDASKAAALYDNFAATPTKDDFDQLVKQIPTALSDVEKVIGRAPDRIREADGTTYSYFLSKTGALVVETRGGRMQPLSAGSWRTWGKTAAEVEMQKYWGFVPILLSLMFFRQFVRARRLRATLDENEMVYGGKRIRYEQITRIDEFHPKGWVDVYYTDESGTEQKLRIDREKIARFDEIIAILSEKKGIENPILVYRRSLDED
ncbi:MAG: hypothetical protein AB7N71_11630, partial [Phycisphaerae bacterium]